MNIPNKLTILRIILVPFFVAFLLINIPHHFLIAGLIFGVASLTDMLDGKIARKNNLITDFGKFADPLADKILVISAFLCFVQLGIIGAVPVIIVLFREFTVTSIRLVAASSGEVVAANIWGKVKTVSQIIVICFIMLFQYILELTSLGIISIPESSLSLLSFSFNIASQALIYISVLFTVISGVIYIKDNIKFISRTK